MEDYIKNINEFANKHEILLVKEGECGFGRECVGLMRGSNWIDYNPTKYPDYENIPELYDDRLYEITPPDAYHKHNCLAVLGRGEDALKQLSEWVDKLKELDVTIEKFETGADGIQAIISGVHGYAVKVNKPKE